MKLWIRKNIVILLVGGVLLTGSAIAFGNQLTRSDKSAIGDPHTEIVQAVPSFSPFPSEDESRVRVSPRVSTPFGMRFPPLEKICDYPVVTFWRRNLLSGTGQFRRELLDRASSCGTNVVVRLHGLTSDIVGTGGVGLDLGKYEDAINDFVGKIDPYVTNGTILGHMTIDEPHDCKNDWGGVCPTQEEVDKAGELSKRYWSALPTIVNTLPSYANTYRWQYTDGINFQYAFHKGDLSSFIDDGLGVLESGKIGAISWSIQAAQGGCTAFGACPMTPEQVIEVGTAICNTQKGLFVSFSSYREDLMTDEMEQSIGAVRAACKS